MERNLKRRSHHTSSWLSLGLKATNITKVPESVPTQFAGSLVRHLPLVSTFTLDKNRAHSIRIRQCKLSAYAILALALIKIHSS